MKKFLLYRLTLLLFVATAWQTAMADDDSPYLQINQTDGSTVTFALNTCPTITHDADNIIVSAAGETVFTVGLDYVDNYQYVGVVPTGIGNVKNSTPSSTTLTNGKALVSGLNAGAHVGIYTVSGQMVSSVAASQDGTAIVDFNTLKSGQVYILRTPTAAYKIYK